MESRDDRPSEAVSDPAGPQAVPPRPPQGSPRPPASRAAPAYERPAEAPHPAPDHPSSHAWIKWVLLGVAVVGLAVGVWFAVPWVDTALNTVSTDDAYVNSHVTFVAPRVAGQVKRDGVLVDDNYRVKKGDVLVQLDPEPYQVQVAIKQAAVEAAKTDLETAKAQVQGLVGQIRANRFKLEHAIEDVNNQVANLRAAVASLNSKKATLELAKGNLKRGEDLAPNGISKEELDQRRQTVKIDEAAVDQASQQVYAIRVGLGLSSEPAKGGDLTDVPPDLDQNYSAVREALGALIQSAAQIGYFPASWNATPKEAIAAFYKQDPEGNLDRIYARLIPEAPPTKQAEAKFLQAKKDLAQAELNLRYCDVVSETDGVVTRRNVNPGNNVQVGQSLMAVRSLTEIWIDANFKETQLADLRIGQRVRCEVDMYGSRREFEGRITGFTMGTGESLALLPPQNATGNYVKIVQRLPVRIELTNYKPDEDALFVGLSVTPYVYYKQPLVDEDIPGKGRKLQPEALLPQDPSQLK